MDILWDSEKNNWLILNRDISFEEISERIQKKEYLDIVDNPKRKDQQYFVMRIEDYIWIIPFLIDENENIILKTAFPSRKFQRKYGGEYEE